MVGQRGEKAEVSGHDAVLGHDAMRSRTALAVAFILVFITKGGIAMVKNVRKYAGHTTALVVIGWFLFLGGQLTELPLVSMLLLAIARVLP